MSSLVPSLSLTDFDPSACPPISFYLFKMYPILELKQAQNMEIREHLWQFVWRKERGCYLYPGSRGTGEGWHLSKWSLTWPCSGFRNLTAKTGTRNVLSPSSSSVLSPLFPSIFRYSVPHTLASSGSLMSEWSTRVNVKWNVGECVKTTHSRVLGK